MSFYVRFSPEGSISLYTENNEIFDQISELAFLLTCYQEEMCCNLSWNTIDNLSQVLLVGLDVKRISVDDNIAYYTGMITYDGFNLSLEKIKDKIQYLEIISIDGETAPASLHDKLMRNQKYVERFDQCIRALYHLIDNKNVNITFDIFTPRIDINSIQHEDRNLCFMIIKTIFNDVLTERHPEMHFYFDPDETNFVN